MKRGGIEKSHETVQSRELWALVMNTYLCEKIVDYMYFIDDTYLWIGDVIFWGKLIESIYLGRYMQVDCCLCCVV